MTDVITQNLLQFGAIVPASMMLTEWLSFPIGSVSSVKGKGNRKRFSVMIYSFGAGLLGLESGFITMPEEGRAKAYIGVLLISCVSVLLGYAMIAAKAKLKP